MTRVAFVIAAVLQEKKLWELTQEAIRSCAESVDNTSFVAHLILVVNRHPLIRGSDITEAVRVMCHDHRRVSVYADGEDRHVAGAWNFGINIALADQADYVLVMNNDARLLPGCLERLVDFGSKNKNVAIWSSWDIKWGTPTLAANDMVADGCDFSCFMLRPETLWKHGYFDENFRPAYFEDNDLYTRVVLGGDHCRVVKTARHFHHGSQTSRHDAERAHHLNHWFGINKAYFQRKWGIAEPANTEQEVLAKCFRYPFNDPSKPLYWWEKRP